MSFIDTRAMRLPATIDADICLIESGTFEPEADTQSLYDPECTGYPLRPD